MARSRDDVLAGMFRCAAIGDTRIWLDCFYGAAQPLRSELGLSPALPGQVRLAQNPPASAASANDPNLRYQVTTEALRCNNLSDTSQWLNCYYGAAQPVRALLKLSPAPQVQIPASVPAAGSPVERPAFAKQGQNWLQITSYSFDRYGMFTVTLASGQQWQQLSGDTSLAHWTKPSAHYLVRITPGALRSHNLKIRGEAAAYKVERIN